MSFLIFHHACEGKVILTNYLITLSKNSLRRSFLYNYTKEKAVILSLKNKITAFVFLNQILTSSGSSYKKRKNTC